MYGVQRFEEVAQQLLCPSSSPGRIQIYPRGESNFYSMTDVDGENESQPTHGYNLGNLNDERRKHM